MHFAFPKMLNISLNTRAGAEQQFAEAQDGAGELMEILRLQTQHALLQFRLHNLWKRE